jgi:hypothetical protein
MIRYSPKFHEVDIKLDRAAASELADLIERGASRSSPDPGPAHREVPDEARRDAANWFQDSGDDEAGLAVSWAR